MANWRVITSAEQHASEIERCGKIFDLARQLLLWDLIDLVTEKFDILCKTVVQADDDKPFVHVLNVARVVYGEPSSEMEGETLMRGLLVQFVAENF